MMKNDEGNLAQAQNEHPAEHKATVAPAHGQLLIVGRISGNLDGNEVNEDYAMFIRFPDKDTAKRALIEGVCTFKF